MPFPADKLETLLARIDGWVAAGTRWIGTDPADIRAATGFVRRVDLGLRAPDALHLAICARVGATLLTSDDRQAAAALALRISLAA